MGCGDSWILITLEMLSVEREELQKLRHCNILRGGVTNSKDDEETKSGKSGILGATQSIAKRRK